jgi:hypothetical protein
MLKAASLYLLFMLHLLMATVCFSIGLDLRYRLDSSVFSDPSLRF